MLLEEFIYKMPNRKTKTGGNSMIIVIEKAHNFMSPSEPSFCGCFISPVKAPDPS